MRAPGRTMSRRYIYSPRWTARDLQHAMRVLDLTAGELAKVSGVGIPRVERWLKGEDDIAIGVQRDLTIWQQHPEGLDLAMEWANRHARDARSENN